MEINEETFQKLAHYLQLTLSPESNVRRQGINK